MATSLGDLSTAIELAAENSPKSPHEIAAAAAALGYLGRALLALRADGLSRTGGDIRERQIHRLAEQCVDLARTAPPAHSRLTELASATADATALVGQQTTVQDRWAIAVTVTDAIHTVSRTLGDLPTASSAAHRLTQIASDTRHVQHGAALDPPSRRDNTVLDSPIPSLWDVTAPAAADARLAEAMATLVHGTGDRRAVLSIAELLAVSLAAEGLVGRVEGTASTRLPRTPRDITARDAWIAVDAALAPFNDGSRRRHTQAPVHVHAALAIYGAAQDHRTTEWALADAVQHLPTVADSLRRSVLAWPTTAAVFADARRLPARDGRGPALVGGDPVDQMVRVDAVDLIPVHDALLSTRVLNGAVADRVGHHQALRAHRSWSAHHEQGHSRDGLSRVSDAQAQAFLRLHSLAAPRRPARSR